MRLTLSVQINACGQMSTSSRNETQLLCNVLGLESLVDEITSALLASSASVTPSAVLGPFYRANAPVLPNGASIVRLPNPPPDASPEALAAAASWAAAAERDSTYLHGRVLTPSGEPIPNAEVDVWHTAPNGLYEQQDPAQPDMNLRGRFRTDADGRYSLYCLRPVSYPIPDDGPSGKLLKALDRHPNRPAHIHFIVTADGYRSLTTQVFDRCDPYLGDDAVFAVKDALVVDFVERKGDEKARWTLEFDFVLSTA